MSNFSQMCMILQGIPRPPSDVNEVSKKTEKDAKTIKKKTTEEYT